LEKAGEFGISGAKGEKGGINHQKVIRLAKGEQKARSLAGGGKSE
jgi:hypothetical protein